MTADTLPGTAAEQAQFIRSEIPPAGFFAGQTWRVSPAPFSLGPELTSSLENLGRVLLQFNRAVNLLYRLSSAGKQPRWIAQWLDQGKPEKLLQWQRAPALKNDVPRVIRPDLLLTDHGFSLTELDSVPGGIGLTAWLNQTYARAESLKPPENPPPLTPESKNLPRRKPIHPAGAILGGADGMLQGFARIFGDVHQVDMVISAESATYLPEMEWLAAQIDSPKIQIESANFQDFMPGRPVYRFFELFDLKNIPAAETLFDLAADGKLRVTPPPKPLFEEKLLFALLWNPHLRHFWRQELGESFLQQLQAVVPFTWIIDPTPIPPHAVIQDLNLTDWQQLKTFSQRQRDLILKISGFSERAWGARGVFLGSDLPQEEWSQAVDLAIRSFSHSPYVLQRYAKAKTIAASWFDFEQNQLETMAGRVRLCPYYFVVGDADSARAQLGGVLATICPAEKKIIHGMKEAILCPCAA